MKQLRSTLTSTDAESKLKIRPSEASQAIQRKRLRRLPDVGHVSTTCGELQDRLRTLPLPPDFVDAQLMHHHHIPAVPFQRSSIHVGYSAGPPPEGHNENSADGPLSFSTLIVFDRSAATNRQSPKRL